MLAKNQILRLSLAVFSVTSAAQTPAPLLPNGIAYDATGNLYIADTAHNQIYEAKLAGQLLVVAGTGTQGFAGDNGPATAAELNAPRGLAFGADGTLFIADTGNQRIRALSPTAGVIANQAIITTFAGTGAAGFAGDGGPATAAQVNHPTALAVDSNGALLLCDTANQRIRRIAAGQITTIAGTGSQGFSGDGGPATAADLDSPSGIAADATGNIYLADTHNHRIRLISSTGQITTIAGTGSAGYSGDNGPATAAELALPQGLALTGSGTLLIADANNQRLRAISNSTITTLAGDGTQGPASDAAPALTAPLNNPRSVALSAFAQPTVGSALIHILTSNALYTPAALTAPARTSNITLTVPINTYGQSTANVTVTGVTTPQGTIQLLDGATSLAQSTLTSAAASIPLPTLAAGTHTLTASYLGDGLNPAGSAASTITIHQAATLVAAASPAATYASQSMPLTATVTPATRGVPTGTVQFFDNTALVATATLSSGSASAIYLSPATGTHSLTAAYLGDTNFLPSTSAAVTAVVTALPDFTFTANSSSQTVVGGSIATYTLAVTPQPGPFTGAVSFSIAGLPASATASFSPPQLVPGALPGTTTLNIVTPVTHVELQQHALIFFSVCVLALFFLPHRRRPAVHLIVLALLPCISLLGCGNRVATATAQAAQTYTLTVTATSTSLTGSLLTHTTNLTLTVR